MAKNKGGRPRKFDDPKVLEAKVKEYFDSCDKEIITITDKRGRTTEQHVPYTMSGLRQHLDMTRKTFAEYIKDDRFSNSLTRAKERIERYIEEMAFLGLTDSRFAQFNLSANFDWETTQKIEQHNIDDTVKDDKYLERYQELAKKMGLKVAK